MPTAHRLPSLPVVSVTGLALIALLASAPSADAQNYAFHEITSADLGAPTTPINRALSISNDGVVIGTVGVDPNHGTSPTDGYEYDTKSGAVSLLNYHAALGGTTFAAISSDSSTVLGFYGSEGTTSSHWFTDKGGSITALPDPYKLLGVDPNKGYVNYNSINNSGTIASAYTTDGFTEKSFLLGANGTLTTFSDPNDNDDYTLAGSINASGTVAGWYVNYNANAAYPIYQYLAYGFLRSADGTYTDFAVPGATDTYLDGLSDNGNLWGQYDVYDPAGNLVKLDNFTDINGVFDTSVDVPGAAATYLTSINDSGQISGLFFDAAGNQHSFYADPVPESSSVVSLGLLLMLGGWTVVARRRTQRPLVPLKP